MNSNLPTVYLAGGMENVSALGAGWREIITPKLGAMGYAVLNPCLFEPKQLKNCKINVLPEFTTREGTKYRPKHWHELKHASYDSAEYKRYKNYMQRIIRYDIDIVNHHTDVVICSWTKGTGKGAGTHSELTSAFLRGLQVYVALTPGVDMPAWAQACCTKIFTHMEDLVEYVSNNG